MGGERGGCLTTKVLRDCTEIIGVRRGAESYINPNPYVKKKKQKQPPQNY